MSTSDRIELIVMFALALAKSDVDCKKTNEIAVIAADDLIKKLQELHDVSRK